MCRLEQPLNHQVLWGTGDLILRAELDLLLKDSQGNWHFFLGDPARTPDPNVPSASLPRCLLGLSGVINQIRIAFDGQPGPGAPHGYLIVEKK